MSEAAALPQLQGEDAKPNEFFDARSSDEDEDSPQVEKSMGSWVVVMFCGCWFVLTLLALGVVTALAFGLANAASQAYVPTVKALAQATGSYSQTTTTQAIPAPNPLVYVVP